MHIRTTVVSLAAALVGVQHMAVAFPDNDVRAGVPLRIDPVCANSEGQIMCASDASLMICNHAKWTFLSNCPEGTMCQNNRCINSADFTKPAEQPVNPPSKAPVPTPTSSSSSSIVSPKPSSSSSTETSMSSSNSKSGSKQSSKSSTKSSTKSSVSSGSSKIKSSSIPNIVVVDKMPDLDMDEDKKSSSRSSSSSAASQSSWNRFHIAIPVVSAIVAPYIIMLLF
ncbi:hypothetical protein GGH94_005005 [Coemansia aciculifera]|uniref:Carbohydrate-binding module family 19 domain-containing protein n=1 Tax=Coemansia aciculifera TaxID=417176 RepID=A0A9W8IJA0_9FUNG|nr:hypothetical protein GGH94_005005 [Coemansia aciculifera]KAJ2870164.1 hypothetical protein GGH93_005780 [Coemansia aciculifera]